MVRLTYLLTNIITLRSIVHLEKLRGIQIVKKFPALNGNRIFITAFTCTLHISWASSIQSLPSHPISWRSILILPFHLCLCIPRDHFLSGFPTKSLYTYLLPHTNFMSLLSNSSRFDHPQNIAWGTQIIKLLIMQSFPFPCHLVPIRPK